MASTTTPQRGTRRARNRLFDSIVLGAVLGMVAGLIATVLAVTLVGLILGNDPNIAGIFVVSGFVSLPVVGGACWILAYEIYVIFRFRPGSPVALSASVLVPYALLSLAISVSGELVVGAVCLAFGAILATAGYRGMRCACRHALGPCRKGIGKSCAHCRYDLSATPEGQVCPECGGTMRYERLPPA